MKKGYKRYRTIIEEENVSQPLKTGDLQESYNKWATIIETFIKTVKRKKTKSRRKDIKELQKIRKRLREEYSTTIELHEKILRSCQIDFLFSITGVMHAKKIGALNLLIQKLVHQSFLFIIGEENNTFHIFQF